MSKDTYLQLDVQELERQLERLTTEYALELEGDDALRADLLEGETDIHSVLSRIIDHRQEASEMVEAIKVNAANLKARSERYERRAEAMTALALRIMTAAQQTKTTLPIATLTVSPGKQSVVIENADELPQGSFKLERKPDKTAIKALIDAGETVPGATLKTGDDYLGVRTR